MVIFFFIEFLRKEGNDVDIGFFLDLNDDIKHFFIFP